MRPHGWSTDPASILSLTTILATLISAIAVKMAISQQRQQAELRIRDQASHISLYQVYLAKIRDRDHTYLYKYRVDNHSGLPIYRLRLVIDHCADVNYVMVSPRPSTWTSKSRGKILRRDQQISEVLLVRSWDQATLNPGVTAGIEVVLDTSNLVGTLRLAFDDAAGKSWILTTHGELRPWRPPW
jgi:hypothetical protein